MEAALTNPSGRMTLGSALVRIGNAQDNHVVINDPNVSAYHAEIRPERVGEYSHTIMDLGSATGTFVNGRRLDNNAPCLLYPNDTIRIGNAVFNYEVIGAPQVEELSPSSFAPGAAPQQGYLSTAHSPPAPFAPPPTGPIAPVMPLRSVSPTYTVASLLEKENRRKIWLAVGITALIILIVALLFGSSHSPGKTLDTYCKALQSGDYLTAFNQLSPAQQGLYTSEAQFASTQSRNKVTSCTSNNVNVVGNAATATLILARSGVGLSTSTVILAQDSSFNWRIDGIKR